MGNQEEAKYGCWAIIIFSVVAIGFAVFWGWVLQFILGWFGVEVSLLVSTLIVLLLQYIGNLFKG